MISNLHNYIQNYFLTFNFTCLKNIGHFLLCFSIKGETLAIKHIFQVAY